MAGSAKRPLPRIISEKPRPLRGAVCLPTLRNTRPEPSPIHVYYAGRAAAPKGVGGDGGLRSDL